MSAVSSPGKVQGGKSAMKQLRKSSFAAQIRIFLGLWVGTHAPLHIRCFCLELQSVTCRVGTQMNVPHLNPSQADQYSIYLPGTGTDGILS